MKHIILLITLAYLPVSSFASEMDMSKTSDVTKPDKAWISGNVLYSDINCGEPIAYVDKSGNVVELISPDR